MILYIPFLKLRKRSVVFGFVFIVLVAVVVLSLLQTKLDDFYTQVCENGGWVPIFGIGFIFEMLIFCVVLLKQGQIMEVCLVSALFGYVVFRLADYTIPGADRISMFFGFLFYLFLFVNGVTLAARIFFIGLVR